MPPTKDEHNVQLDRILYVTSLSETAMEMGCNTLNWVICHKSALKKAIKSSHVYIFLHISWCARWLFGVQKILISNIKSLPPNQTVMQLQPKSSVCAVCLLSQIRGRRLNTSCDPPEGERILYFFWAHGPLSWGTRWHQIGSRREQPYSFPSCPGIDRQPPPPSSRQTPPREITW